MPYTIGLTSTDSASVCREDLFTTVVELSVISLTLTVLWGDASAVDSGVTCWTLTAGVWLDFTALLGVGVLGPSTSQWASVCHQTVEDKWLSALLWAESGRSPEDSFACDGGADLVVGGQDVTHSFLGFHFCGGVKRCTVGGTTSHHVVVHIHGSVAAVESCLEWVTGVCGGGLLVSSTTCQTGTTWKLGVGELLENSLGTHWCFQSVFVFSLSVHVTANTTDVVPGVEWGVFVDGQHEGTVSVYSDAHVKGGGLDVH